MNWRRLAPAILIVGLLSAGGFWAYTQFLAPQTEDELSSDPDLVSVDTGNDLVSAEGVVLPLSDAQLAFPSGGQIVEVMVAEGNVVQVGMPLLRLDSIDQEIGVRQAETAVLQAQANIETAAAGLLAAQTDFEAAQVGVTAAEAQVALIKAAPTDAQIVLSEKSIAVAEAAIMQAAGSRDVTLDAATSAEVSAAEAQLLAAQIQYDDALKAYQPILQNEDIDDESVIEQAQLQLNAAQANLAAAQAALDEVFTGATSGERTAVLAGVQVAVNQRDAAQSQLDLLLSGAKPEQIALGEAGVVQAETAVTEATIRIAQAESAVQQANAALAEAEAAFAAAQSALNDRTLIAPFAGTVASIPVKMGQVVAPGVPVLILADMSSWKIETTDLTELNVVALQREFDVNITIDAFPGETFSGQIIDIATTSVESRGDITYAVTIALEDDLTVPLRWGMTAFVTVDTDQ
jgi:HlyD family secretion protein